MLSKKQRNSQKWKGEEMIAEYIAKIENIDGIYAVTFPDFKITGRGYADLELTRQMAGYMLAEIILDHEAKGRPLPQPSFTMPTETATTAIFEAIRVDADEYALDSRRDEAARYYEYV